MSVLLEERSEASPHVVTLILNRPEKLNALNYELVSAMDAAITKLSADASVRVVILTGAGEKAFVAGADIEAMSAMTVGQAKAFADLGHRVGGKIEAAPFVVIGAINGFALGGGCELALACDFLYASDRAKFGQPEVNLGVIPGFGGTQRLTRRVGAGIARELCFTGDIVGAEEARRMGLVNAVVPGAELRSRVMEVASKIASKGPLAVAACKRVMVRGEDISLPVACELEAQAFASLFDSKDQKEGMAAFIAKRAAAFTGT
jgi:enoyl-CoA hydratase